MEKSALVGLQIRVTLYASSLHSGKIPTHHCWHKVSTKMIRPPIHFRISMACSISNYLLVSGHDGSLNLRWSMAFIDSANQQRLPPTSAKFFLRHRFWALEREWTPRNTFVYQICRFNFGKPSAENEMGFRWQFCVSFWASLVEPPTCGVIITLAPSAASYTKALWVSRASICLEYSSSMTSHQFQIEDCYGKP